MKLLLTSSGITKQAIADALVALTGKPAGETKIAFVPTAANPEGGNKDWFVNQFLNLWRFGYHWIDIVDPTAPGVDWKARLLDVDVIFLSGGNTFYLLDQFRKIGFAKWIQENLGDRVYVGASASTVIATPTIEVASLPEGDANLPGLTDLTGFNWVDFEIEPHCDKDRFAVVEKYAAAKPYPVYAIDDQTALKVVDSKVDVISEGTWQVF
jgi:dipeptidase E